MLHISLEAAELFLSCFDGQASLSEVLRHRAYKTIFNHFELFGSAMGSAMGGRLTEEDVARAMSGQSSKFKGLERLRENMPRIKRLMATIESSRHEWAERAYRAVASVVEPRFLGDIWVYPVLGYDLGIGLKGAVCMNLNANLYMEHHMEFLYFIMHEAFHVAYERIHTIPMLRDVRTPEDWLRFFDIMLQNEGYATYVALAPREAAGHMQFKDYAVLNDPVSVREHIARLFSVREAMLDERLGVDERISMACGSDRLTYRVGCEMIRRVHYQYGSGAVSDALLMDGRQFWQRYSHLLQA